MKEKQIVEIEWIDSIHDSCWKRKDVFESESGNSEWMWHKTVGYFLCEDKESMTVMQSMTIKDGQYNTDARMTIPKCAIRKKRVIK